MSGQKSSSASLPNITLTAAGSGREFPLATLGIPTVLILHGQETASAAAKVNRAVRKEYPLATEILIASGADVNARDAHQVSSLVWASGRGHQDIVRLLLGMKETEMAQK